MSLTVWKFAVPIGQSKDVFTLTMPQGAEPLCVQTQHEQPHIWALVDPASPPDDRAFRIAGTGHPIDETIVRYLGTFQIVSGHLVFHVFEVEP